MRKRLCCLEKVAIKITALFLHLTFHSLDDDSAERQGKYLLYWLTKTAVATTTSYVNTITLASLQCTPSQFTMSNCASI